MLAALIGIALAAPANASWNPAGGLSASAAPHLALPVTAADGRSVGLGGGFHLDLGHWSRTRTFWGLRMSSDGLVGDDEQGGDTYAMSLLALGGVDMDLTKRWQVQTLGGLGWARSDGPGDAKQGYALSAVVSVQRRARLRHMLLGWELSALWLGAPQTLVLQTGPVLRWQR